MWDAWVGDRRKDQSLSRPLSITCQVLPANSIRSCGNSLPACKQDPHKKLFSVWGSCKLSHYLHWTAAQWSRAEELDTGDRWDIRIWFLPHTNEGSKFSCNMQHQDIYCLQVFMKIYENPMRFTDFRRNYCAPGNLFCKVWYLFPVVICCPFFPSHHALFMVVLVGEPNATDSLHQQEETIQIENPPWERMTCLFKRSNMEGIYLLGLFF